MTWEQIPSTNLLYSGRQAHQIKSVVGDRKDFIENAFYKHEADSSGDEGLLSVIFGDNKRGSFVWLSMEWDFLCCVY